MAGRPRRRRSSSASATGSTDQAPTRWFKESSIIKPLPQDTPEERWPCFHLIDATIYRKDGRTLANPLLVHVQGPLVVRGLLIHVEGDDLIPNLVKPGVRSAYIEITHSDQYSIGDRLPGPNPIGLWVSGAAGWFEIRPSVKYQPSYHQVEEAIKLYYSAYEAYEEYNLACRGKKKAQRPKPPTLDQIFLKYAIRAGDGILRNEVEALCHKWAEFLISHFNREVDLDWNPTLFAKQLRERHPDIQKRITDIANGLIPPPPPPPPEPQETQDLEETKAAQQRRSRSARASSRNSEAQDEKQRLAPSRSPQPKPGNTTAKAKMTETPVPLPEKYRQYTQPALSAASSAAPASSKPSPAPAGSSKGTPRDTPMGDTHSDAVDRLVVVLQEIAGETKLKKAAPSTVSSKVYFRCKMRQAKNGNHYTSGVIDVFTYYAKELLARLGPEWKGIPWYEWLEGVATQPWNPVENTKPEEFPAQTFRRAKAAPKAPATPVTQLPPTINLKSKIKEAESEGESEDDIGLYAAPPPRSRRSGKGATLTLASTSKKRPLSDLDGHYGGRRGTKSAKLSHYSSDEDDQQEEAEESSDEDIPAGSRLPLPEGAVRVVVHAERIPTTSPTGPDGTWTCDEDGCTYVVRSADDQGAQELIQEHFREHARQADKVSLAVEESRGQMPINNLLSKLQALGKAALFKKQETINGRPVPQPVKRRLLL